jgi:hypothetical protein
MVSGIGMNLILGFYNDPVGLAYKEYLYKCYAALAKEVKDSHAYIRMEGEMRDESTEAFNDRKGKMLTLGLCRSPPEAQALGMRNDKEAYRAVLNLPKGVSATRAMNEAGITGKKRVAKELNHDGTRRLRFLRTEVAMYIEDNPNVAPDAVAKIVAEDLGKAWQLKNMRTLRPIGYKKQAKRMFSKMRSKKSLQRQNMLH